MSETGPLWTIVDLCLAGGAGWVARREQKTGAGRIAFGLWLALTLTLMVLAYHHATGWLFFVSDRIRHRAYADGWYLARREYQTEAVEVIVAAVAILLALGAALLGKRWQRTLPALVALLYLLGYNAIRQVSLHQIDALLGRITPLGQPLLIWLQLGGVLVTATAIAWGAFASKRLPTTTTETAPDTSPLPNRPAISNRALWPHMAAIGVALYAAAHAPLASHPAFGIVFVLIAFADTVFWFGVSRRRTSVGFVPIALLRAQNPVLGAATVILFLFAAFRSHPFAEMHMPGYWELLAGLCLLVSTADRTAATRDLRPLLYALIGAGGVLALEGFATLIAQGHVLGALENAILWRNLPFESPLRLGRGIEYHNTLSMLFIAVGSLSLSLLRLARSWRERILWLGVTGALFVALLLTGSRGAAPFFALMAMLHTARWSPRWRLAAALAGTLGFLLILARLLRSGGGVLRGDASLKTRFHIAKASLLVLRDHPIFGGGADAFPEMWKRYGPGVGYSVPLVAPDGLYPSLISEGGMLLLGAVAVTATVALRDAFTLARRLPDSQREPLVGFIIAVIVGLLHGLLETSLRAVPLLVYLSIAGGVLAGLTYRASDAKTLRKSPG